MIKFEFIKETANLDRSSRDNYASKIVALSERDDFEDLQKDPLFAEIFDTAVRYLDKELAEEKYAYWMKLLELFQTYNK